MAKIKIYQSQASIQQQREPNVTSLAIDPSVGTNFGAAISSLGKVIEDVRAKTRKTSESIEVADLTTKAHQKIILEKDKYKFSTNVEDIDTFTKSIDLNSFASLLEGKNNRIKSQFNFELRKVTNEESTKLLAQILKQNAIKNFEIKENQMFKWDLAEANPNDPIGATKAKIAKRKFFESPENLAQYGSKALNTLKETSILRTKKLQYKNRIKNGESFNLLKEGEKIKSEVGEKAAEIILTDAKNKITSDYIQEILQNKTEEKADTNKKVYIYAHLIQKHRDGESDISLFEINELYKKGQINSVQRNSLYRIYTGDQKVSKENAINMIEASLSSAESIEDFDIIRNQVLFDGEYALELGVKDIDKYISLFEKYEKDLPAFQEFKKNKKLLEADLGKIESGFTIFSNTSKKPPEKLRINAVDYYEKLVLSGTSPNDAYLKTVSNFINDSTMPGIKDFTSFSSYVLPKPTESETKSPSEYIKNNEKQLSQLYKDGKITVQEFSSDIRSLAQIKELIDIRTELKKDPFGFSKKASVDTTRQEVE
jgi:hypothetical protein